MSGDIDDLVLDPRKAMSPDGAAGQSVPAVEAVVACWNCGGRGVVTVDVPKGETTADYGWKDVPCGSCSGTGLVRIVAKASDVPTVTR